MSCRSPWTSSSPPCAPPPSPPGCGCSRSRRGGRSASSSSPKSSVNRSPASRATSSCCTIRACSTGCARAPTSGSPCRRRGRDRSSATCWPVCPAMIRSSPRSAAGRARARRTRPRRVRQLSAPGGRLGRDGRARLARGGSRSGPARRAAAPHRPRARHRHRHRPTAGAARATRVGRAGRRREPRDGGPGPRAAEPGRTSRTAPCAWPTCIACRCPTRASTWSCCRWCCITPRTPRRRWPRRRGFSHPACRLLVIDLAAHGRQRPDRASRPSLARLRGRGGRVDVVCSGAVGRRAARRGRRPPCRARSASASGPPPAPPPTHRELEHA